MDRRIAPRADASVHACMPMLPIRTRLHTVQSIHTLTAHARRHAAVDTGRVPAPWTLRASARPIASAARVPAAAAAPGPRCTLACACPSTCTHTRRMCVHAPGARRRRRMCMHAPTAHRRPDHAQERGAHGTECGQPRPPPPQRLRTGPMLHGSHLCSSSPVSRQVQTRRHLFGKVAKEGGVSLVSCCRKKNHGATAAVSAPHDDMNKRVHFNTSPCHMLLRDLSYEPWFSLVQHEPWFSLAQYEPWFSPVQYCKIVAAVARDFVDTERAQANSARPSLASVIRA